MSGKGSPSPSSAAPTTTERPDRHVWLAIVAVAMGLLAGLGLGYATRDTLALALDEVMRDPTQVELLPTLAMVLIVLVPLLTAVATYFLAWQTVRLLQLARYLARVHRHVSHLLQQHAPLLRMGFSGSGLPFGPDGQPRLGMEQPLSAILPGTPGTLLLGDDGAGKSTALRQCAFELSRRRHLWSVAFGYAPLPIIVPLAAYAAAPIEPGRPRVRFLTEQVAAFGHRRLAQRLTSALMRWHVVLLCDGLDEVPAADQHTVTAELAQLASAAYPGVRVVVTCALNPYLEQAEQLADIAVLPRVVVTGIAAHDVSLILRRARRERGGPRRSPGEMSAHLASSTLGAQVRHPATLAAWIELYGARRPVPSGRGRLLHAYADMLLRRGTAQDADTTQPLQSLLAHFANALRTSGRSYVAIPDTTTAGQAMADWLASTPTLTPFESQPLAPLDLAPDDMDRLLVAAVAAGVLEWLPARSGVRFAQPGLAATYAALSLDHASVGSEEPGFLASDLLTPTWHEPLLLWAGFSAQPGALATLLVRQAASVAPESIPLLALGMAAALEAHAPILAPGATGADGDVGRIQEAYAQLRDLFDRVQTTALLPENRARLASELAIIERGALVDLGGLLSIVATASSMGRLVRAQAISLLGLFSTPSATDTLLACLHETDPVLREATDRAFAVATPSALARIQPLLSSGDEHLRARATEALTRAGPAAIETALDGLSGTDPRQRAAAARVLGTLRASSASEPLLALLDDPDGRVRVAAAEALGQIGGANIVPRIEARLATADAELRVALAGALGSLRQPQALSALLSLLGDADARVRAAAAEALGRLGDDRAVRPLRERLVDADPWAQAAAATALRRLGTR